MSAELSRRAWLSTIASLPLGVALAAVQESIALAIQVHGPLDGETHDGVALGLKEANQTGALLGVDVRESRGATRETLVGVIGNPSRAIVRSVPIVRVTPAATTTRASCEYAVTPPVPTRTALLAAWKASHPSESGNLTIEEWHPSLQRFGATEISTRFKRAYGRPMSSAAWRGWCAVKALTESALQNNGIGSCANLDKLRFDAHKGAALSFNTATGVLDQPLYVVRHDGSDSRVVGDVR